MLTALERVRQRQARQAQADTPNRPTNPTKPRAGSLTLAEFAVSGQQVVIYSDVLDCELVFAADNADVSETEARPVYRARELAVVWKPDGSISAKGLRLLHETKTRFNAEIEEEREQP